MMSAGDNEDKDDDEYEDEDDVITHNDGGIINADNSKNRSDVIGGGGDKSNDINDADKSKSDDDNDEMHRMIISSQPSPSKQSLQSQKIISYASQPNQQQENDSFTLSNTYNKENRTKVNRLPDDIVQPSIKRKERPRGSKFKTEIDFIITNKASAFTDTNIVKNLNFNTDHRMQTRKQRKLFKLKDTRTIRRKKNADIKYRGQRKTSKKITNLTKEIKDNMRKDRKEKRNRVLEENIKRTGGTKKAIKQLSEHGLATIPEVIEVKENKVDEVPEILGSEGIRQGDPLSPTLFNAVLKHIFRQLNWNHLGLNINGARLNHLRLADDLVLLEEDPATIKQVMQSLANKSREVGLEINASKTKLMANSWDTDVMVDGNKIEYVKEYIYLGQILSPSDEMTKEINRRIVQGWRKYWSLMEIVKSKDLVNHIKSKTFESCILPVLTFGCKT
ncbi:Putative uncharacterized transposon-derived protein F52C9.6 [Eumeta japonica]|uniref:Uncharacterized transposon-derived protein F52C9.6 n=1 Tax=Eumeta variegata TaxID=151549 RepID=A0A4C1YUA1_EUMVA|nr:Putative uncharacterized transposon-derived protein F52C9.6 [Eumeta japonica]